MQTGSIEGDPVRLADWAELQVLYSKSTHISWESIRTEVDVEGLLEGGEEPCPACRLGRAASAVFKIHSHIMGVDSN